MTFRSVSLLNSLRQIPGWMRPARPCLCFADALDAKVFTSISPPERLFTRISRTVPVSITQTQSEMVTEVSAMFVERIIFRRPFIVWNGSFCSDWVSLEWRGIISKLLLRGEKLWRRAKRSAERSEANYTKKTKKS